MRRHLDPHLQEISSYLKLYSDNKIETKSKEHPKEGNQPPNLVVEYQSDHTDFEAEL